jgi:hypothetical protein
MRIAESHACSALDTQFFSLIALISRLSIEREAEIVWLNKLHCSIDLQRDEAVFQTAADLSCKRIL